MRPLNLYSTPWNARNFLEEMKNLSHAGEKRESRARRVSRVSPIAAMIKAIVDAGAFENSEPDEVVLKRATVSVTVLLVKEAQPAGGYDPRPCVRTIPPDIKST